MLHFFPPMNRVLIRLTNKYFIYLSIEYNAFEYFIILTAMTLTNLTEVLKVQFAEISAALFNDTLNIDYLEDKDRIFGEASSMFGANIIRYSNGNFEYFYIYHKYLLNKLDIVDLCILNQEIPKLNTKQDILSLAFIRQVDNGRYTIPSVPMFFKLNFVANLFVFFHEAGHVNQQISVNNASKETNHFLEFNSDYYAFSKTLNYYHALRKTNYINYCQRATSFGSEQHFIRCVIATSLIVIYFSCLANTEADESETHPSINKRFCHLLYQMQIQLEDNFSYLFETDKLSDFLVDIFHTLDFIEVNLFEKDEMIFDDILNYCPSCFEEVKEVMKNSNKFDQFNT